MIKLVLNQEKITDKAAFISICPFGALEEVGGVIEVNAACKMCKLCVKNGPLGAAEMVEEGTEILLDKSLWKGICVYVDHVDGEVHPVTLELIGKARELADKVGHKVYCVLMGYGITEKANELLHYGVDEVFVYDQKPLHHFKIDAYTAVFEDFINEVKPCSILVGATTVGRQLAPRVAARFRTGLTADCTVLDIGENTDLIQIRPAFGGNIMAQIFTPNARPQLATVRYKVMDAPQRNEVASGLVKHCKVDEEKLVSKIKVLDIIPKPKETMIENADVLIVAGRGVKSEQDLKMLKELADLLGGEMTCTRPMIESGWMDAKRQIGLSGRTVRPKLIITCGVSGAVQFTAGMNNAEAIFAINKDEKAPIFKIAHYGIVGNLYEVIPQLVSQIKELKEA